MVPRIILLFSLLTACASWGEGPTPELSKFPKVNRIWMGLEDGAIRPKNYGSFKTDAARFVVLHAKDGQMLKKDQHWLTVDPEELEIERNALAIEEEKFKVKLREERWNVADVVEKKKLALDNLKSKRDELLGFLEQEENIGQLQERIQKGLADLDKKIKRTETQLKPENINKKLELIESEGLLDLKRKRKRLDLLERRSTVKASFDGELRLSKPIKQKIANAKDPSAPIWIENNTTVATLVDEKHYEIVVKLTNAYARKAKPEELVAVLQDSQTGSLIKGTYDRVEEVETGAGIRYNYIFKLDNLNTKMAKHSSGESHFVHMYRKFPEMHSLVHKKDIAFIAPTVLKERGWAGLVKHLWPQSKVLQVGPQTIMIKSLNEN